MRKKFVYFEEKPLGGFLPKALYSKSALVLGRACLDTALIFDNCLVLVERSVEPVKGLWMAGGRIHWDKFDNVYQYAARTAQEHFGIVTQPKAMTLLHPRFICFSKRPYPEILLCVVITISKSTFKKISLSPVEQCGLILIRKKADLTAHLKKIGASKQHREVFLDLWSELHERKLLV